MARAVLYERRSEGVTELFKEPRLRALLATLAGHAQQRAEALAPEGKTGDYARSFGHQLVDTGKERRPVGRAFNTSPYAATVELGGRKTRKRGRLKAGGPKHRCLGRGLDSLQGAL